ncbi:MAG TPA: YihY family inner membrane protein [Gammaproteobacteria bacterium]|nr:YihY family inner membrane protein [Gammaproteobacteria bacterium]
MDITRIKAGLVWSYYFCRFVLAQFSAHRGFQSASSLAYTTLLSVVPLVGVIFSFFGNLPLFREISDTLQEFIFGNFVPAFGNTIREYLINFSVNASKLTITGIVLLVVIALMMMATIETAINHIWNVFSRRNALARFLIYWTILSLGPLLVGIGMYSTSYLLALPLLSTADTTLALKQILFTFMPFFTSTIAFTLMYILIPNCRVLIRYALAGAVFAALLFELAKFGFGTYVRAVPTYQMIYGAIASIPMFLIWIYLSWVIILLGAQVAYCLSVFRLVDAGDKRYKHDWEYVDAYKILAELWQAQRQGQQLSSIQLKRRGLDIPHLMMNQILETLKKAGWVHRTSSGKWLLIRDLNDVTLLDLHRLLPCKFPLTIEESTDRYLQSLRQVVSCHSDALESELSVPIGQVLRQCEFSGQEDQAGVSTVTEK